MDGGPVTTNPAPAGVPLLDLKRALPTHETALTAAFTRVLRSGHYVMGPEVDAFEAAAAEYCGSQHALAVSSGTDALLLALMGLDIGQGDEVVVPTYTFFASAGSVWRLGARPVFADVCPGCYNILPSALPALLSPRTRALMPVHLYGQCAAMDEVLAVARSRDLPVVEDAAQALGAETVQGRAGALGTVGCFSFFPSKNLGALGDAGLVTTQESNLAAKMRVLRVHGGAPKYYHAQVGGNFRMDALQAALLGVKLPHLDADTAQRQNNAALYGQLFAESGLATAGTCVCRGAAMRPQQETPIVLPITHPGRHIYNQYIIRLTGDRRDRVRAHLADLKIGSEIYYPVPLHLQACFSSLGYKAGDLPHAERAAAQTLALPIFPELSAEEIGRVAQAVIQACGG